MWFGHVVGSGPSGGRVKASKTKTQLTDDSDGNVVYLLVTIINLNAVQTEIVTS